MSDELKHAFDGRRLGPGGRSPRRRPPLCALLWPLLVLGCTGGESGAAGADEQPEEGGASQSSTSLGSTSLGSTSNAPADGEATPGPGSVEMPVDSDLPLAMAPPVTAAGPEASHFLSDWCAAREQNAWGPIERDLSNGEQGAGDGGPLSVADVVHT